MSSYLLLYIFQFLVSTQFIIAQEIADGKKQDSDFGEIDQELDSREIEHILEAPLGIKLSNGKSQQIWHRSHDVVTLPLDQFLKLKVLSNKDLLEYVKKNKSKKGVISRTDLVEAFSFISEMGDKSDAAAIVNKMAEAKIDVNKDSMWVDKNRTVSCLVITGVESEALYGPRYSDTLDEMGNVLEKGYDKVGIYILDTMIKKMKINPTDLKCNGKSLLEYLDYVIKMDFEEQGLSLSEVNQAKIERDKIAEKYFPKAPKIAATKIEAPKINLNSGLVDIGDIRIEIIGNQLSNECKSNVIDSLMEDAVKRYNKFGGKETLELFNLNIKGQYGYDSICVGKMKIYRINSGAPETVELPTVQNPIKTKKSSATR